MKCQLIRLLPLSALYHLQQLDWREKDCMDTVRTFDKKIEYQTNTHSLFKERGVGKTNE